MEKPESLGYSWAWVTGSICLSHGPCELLFCFGVAKGTTIITLYNGEDNSGQIIVPSTGNNYNFLLKFDPPKPIYCDKGLYVDVDSNIVGVFVQWRELRH